VLRQGSFVTNPSQDFVLQPDDRLISLGTAEQLEALADKRRAELANQSEAGDWRLYEETSYAGPGSIDDPEYLLQYRWSRAPQHCTALDTEVIALSSSYPDSPYGFVAVGGSCEDVFEIYGEQVQAILDSFTP